MTKLISLSVFYFVAVIIIAHFFVPSEYHWSQHTVSDLAAQGLKYQWIMQAGFIGFGLLLNIGLVSKFIIAKRIFYPDLLIMFYGLAVLLSGLFSADPWTGRKWHRPSGERVDPACALFGELHLAAG